MVWKEEDMINLDRLELMTQGVACLVNDKTDQPCGAGHIGCLKERPLPAVGFPFHDGDGTHALHGENIEDHQR